ncbi:MAG: methyltransferase domain-containing protein [Gammaproteobacteria bacterium]|nr:methyltransferase domain-containing protein [Gammaproteobacteria bacterium]
MDARLQRRVQRYGWDKAARDYEAGWRAQLEPAQSLMLELIALRPGERVLDVACGTGLVTFRAVDAVGASGSVVGTDISAEMVETARRLADAKGIRNATFARCDAEAMDLDNESFDAAVCALGLMYVPDPTKALGEMRRLLAPGGRAAAAVWGARRSCGWAEIFPIVDARIASEVCPLFFQLGTGDSLARCFEQAGFVDVRLERIAVDLRYANDDEALGAAFRGGPVALAYSRFDEPTRRAVHAEYLRSIEPYRSGTGYRIPGEFVAAVGVKHTH